MRMLAMIAVLWALVGLRSAPAYGAHPLDGALVSVVVTGGSTPYSQVRYDVVWRSGTAVATHYRSFVNYDESLHTLRLVRQPRFEKLLADVHRLGGWALSDAAAPTISMAGIRYEVEVAHKGKQHHFTVYDPEGQEDPRYAAVVELVRHTVTELAGSLRFRNVFFEPGTYGYLNLTSVPVARVFIDDRAVGLETPVYGYELKAGKHTVRLESTADRGGVCPIPHAEDQSRNDHHNPHGFAMSVDGEDRIRREALRLAQGVRAIEDSRLWPPVVQRFLAECDPGDVAEVMRRLICLAHLAKYRRTFHALMQCMLAGRTLDYERSEQLYRAACQLNYLPVQLVLLRAPPKLVPGKNEVLLDLTLRDVPLGRRKTMARSRDRDVLSRLIMDPAEGVVEILLDNPRLVEVDVVRLVARRPNLPDLLYLVAAHPKWSLRMAVQEAMVNNPYTPTSLASAYVPFLNRNQLEEIEQDARLHAVVREVAGIVRAWRGGGDELDLDLDSAVYEVRNPCDDSPLDGLTEEAANTDTEDRH